MKKLVSLFLTVVMASSLCTFSFASPSNWALNDVNTAKGLGIYNSAFEDNFQKPITRAEFCSLVVKTLDKWESNTSGNSNTVKFTDTSDSNVIKCAELGIVSGVGNGKFEPNSPITREQAGKMLYNTIDKATPVISDYKKDNKTSVNGVFLPHVFSDGAKIHNWARNEIYAMYHLGIMLGTDSENFSPLGSYTREQAVCTFLRLYNTYKSPENVSKPDAELYPDSDTAGKLSPSYNTNRYYLDASYVWNTGEYNYDPKYYDGFGNTYTSSQKGYVYPVNAKYLQVLTSSGAGVAQSVVLNKQGDEAISDVYDVEDINGDNVIYISNNDHSTYIYNSSTGENNGPYNYVVKAGSGMYKFKNSDADYVGYFNSNFKEVIPCVYKDVSGKFENNLTVLQKQDNSFIIVNTSGQILKSFKLDLSQYTVDAIDGTNMILKDNKTGQAVLYRAYSQKYVTGYGTMSFTSNGCILASTNGKNYLLGMSGQLIFDAYKKGYDSISEIQNTGCYEVYKFNKNNWSKIAPYDIIDSNGNVIRQNVPTFDRKVGENDITAYLYNNSITTYDSYGKDIGNISGNGTIKDFKFINGLLLVNITNNGKESVKYYTPTGEEVNLF